MTETTILIVEDEADLGRLCEHIFVSEGYGTIVANDGQQAVELYRQFQENITIVLMDLSLPTLDGREVFASMLEINPNVRVVFMSGYIDETLGAELLQAGSVGLIHKPYSREAILNKVRQMLHQA